MDNSTKIQHPSFGVMSISRTHHGDGHYMCGTDLRPTNTIRIVIYKNCEQVISEHTGRHVYPHGNYDERVEVEMTYSQFSNMICSMNEGDGTPCNIIHYGKDGAIEPYNEPVETQFEYSYKKVVNLLKNQSNKYEKARKDISELISKLPKSKQEDILNILYHLEKDITDSAPFFLDQVAETSEKIVNRAKSEISHYMDNAVHTLGMKALSSYAEDGKQPGKFLSTELDDLSL